MLKNVVHLISVRRRYGNMVAFAFYTCLLIVERVSALLFKKKLHLRMQITKFDSQLCVRQIHILIYICCHLGAFLGRFGYVLYHYVKIFLFLNPIPF